MNLSKQQQILAWAILLICVISVPVGLVGKAISTASADKNSSESDRKFSLMGQKDRILVVRLAGTIYNDEDESSGIFADPNSPTYVRKQLRKAANDDSVKAVLLRVNSPGGTVAMSQEINDAVNSVKKKGKPVIVSMGDVAASGGYYIACAADKIYASEGTLTGSIGVIMHLMNLSEIEKKIGIAPVTIKSGQFKDIGTMDRAPTKEEVELLQNIIMDSYDQFVTAISNGRKMEKEQVKKLADGRIYSGRQALKAHLVDAIGGYEEALKDIKEVCKKKYGLSSDLPVDEGKPSMSFLDVLVNSQMKLPASKSEGIAGLIPEALNPRFANMPLWLME